MLPQAIGDISSAEDVLQKCATDTGASLAQGLLSYLPSAKQGGSEKWKWEKSGNRLYISKGDEAEMQQQEKAQS